MAVIGAGRCVVVFLLSAGAVDRYVVVSAADVGGVVDDDVIANVCRCSLVCWRWL